MEPDDMKEREPLLNPATKRQVQFSVKTEPNVKPKGHHRGISNYSIQHLPGARFLVGFDEVKTVEIKPEPQKETTKAVYYLFLGIFGTAFLMSMICLILFFVLNSYVLDLIVAISFGATALCGIAVCVLYERRLVVSTVETRTIVPEVIDKGPEQPHPDMTLLEGFRRGDFQHQLKHCDAAELCEMLPVIALSICSLGFGLTQFRSSLFVLLAERIGSTSSLDQAWRFFLNTYHDVQSIRRTWSSHPYLEQETDITTYLEYTASPTGRKSVTSASLIQDAPINAVIFFKTLFAQLVKKGDRVNVNPEWGILDPICGEPLVSLQVRLVLNSNAAPIVVDSYTRELIPIRKKKKKKRNRSRLSGRWPIGHDEKESSDEEYGLVPIQEYDVGDIHRGSVFIFKRGDDLRKDCSCMLMQKFMNMIWQENNIEFRGQPVRAMTYLVVPMGKDMDGKDFGCLEFVNGCDKIENIQQHMGKNLKSDEAIANIIATTAGSYVAAFVLGLRDRHSDNILCLADGTVFHIDFNYILGEKVSGLDATRVSFHPNFLEILGPHWDDFMRVVKQSYQCLRDNYHDLLDYSHLVFKFLNRDMEVEDEFTSALKTDVPAPDALQYISEKFDKAKGSGKGSVQNRLKDAIHKVHTEGLTSWALPRRSGSASPS